MQIVLIKLHRNTNFIMTVVIKVYLLFSIFIFLCLILFNSKFVELTNTERKKTVFFIFYFIELVKEKQKKVLKLYLYY